MKVADLTVFESSSSPTYVRFVCNTARTFEPLARCFPDTFVQTFEAQTFEGLNYRTFEDICWRNNLTVADAR